MLFRLLAFACVLVVFVLPGIVYADDAEKARAFAQFVREGDRARLTGRNPDAVTAYRNALGIRHEPRILGRLGIVYLNGGLAEDAAHYLSLALIDISGIPQDERWLIVDAFNRARSVLTRVKVNISHLGADIMLDGKPIRSKSATNSFYFFVSPGQHELRATLEGFEDAVMIVDAKKGDTMPVSLELKAIPQPPPPPPPPPAPPLECPACPPCKLAEPEKPTVKRVPGPWSFGVGAVALSGAISYVPAAGLVAGVDYRYGEWLSFRLDGRVLWSPKYETRRPVRGITFGGSLGACANQSIYFGCLVAHVGGIGHSLEMQNNPEIVWRARFGGGPVVGIVLPFYREFSARISAELVILQDGTRVLTGSHPYPWVVWSGPPVLGGLSLTLVWRPELRVLR